MLGGKPSMYSSFSWQNTWRLQWLVVVSCVNLTGMWSLCGPIKLFLLVHDSIPCLVPPANMHWQILALTPCAIMTDTDTCRMLHSFIHSYTWLEVSQILVLSPRASSSLNIHHHCSYHFLSPVFQLPVPSWRALLGPLCHPHPHRTRLEIVAAENPSNCEWGPCCIGFMHLVSFMSEDHLLPMHTGLLHYNLTWVPVQWTELRSWTYATQRCLDDLRPSFSCTLVLFLCNCYVCLLSYPYLVPDGTRSTLPYYLSPIIFVEEW